MCLLFYFYGIDHICLLQTQGYITWVSTSTQKIQKNSTD